MKLTDTSRSIASRLTRMNLLVSGAALIIAALAFFSYDLFSFRESLIHNLEAEAQIVGDNSIGALLFSDQESAATTLQSLGRSPDVLSAVLVTADGNVFASYKAPGQDEADTPPLREGQIENAWANKSHVLVAHRVMLKGRPAGTVYISARLREIGERARQYLLIAGIILLLCMAAALVISSAARRFLAQPIISLANTALTVSRDQDYSVRATTPGETTGEISVLVDAFNTMLQQIQERDAALIHARDQLELRVEERTAELLMANRELEAFSYTVAHDLRGPLDAVTGIVFLLTQSLGGTDADARAMLDQLASSTSNMAALIDDLLNFARATTDPLKREQVDLTKIVREVAEELSSAEPAREVQLTLIEMPPVEADEGLMRIVLGNLLRNAWKYTSHHEHAAIRFGAKLIDGVMTYFVEDDGAGFNPDLAGQLFRPFERLHSKSEFPGTGIGLATVQRILERQGGRIWAEGAVEHGATFYFTLGPVA